MLIAETINTTFHFVYLLTVSQNAVPAMPSIRATDNWQVKLDWLLTHLVCDVVDHNGRLGTSVVHGGQTVVALLTSCVPDLKLDCRVIQTYCLSQKGSCRRTKVVKPIQHGPVTQVLCAAHSISVTINFITLD